MQGKWEYNFYLMKTDYHISPTTASMRNKLKKYEGEQCHYFTSYYNTRS
jgi:hypothetical protein